MNAIVRTWAKRIVSVFAAAAMAAVLAVGLGCGPAEEPPAPPEAERPAETTPEPWEYDEARDRHWHPGHGHWHPGPPPEDAEAPPADAQEGADEAELPWLDSLPESLEAAREADTLVLAYAHAEWCGFCRQLEAETLSNPEVRERLEDFTLLKIDTDEQGELAQRLAAR